MSHSERGIFFLLFVSSLCFPAISRAAVPALNAGYATPNASTTKDAIAASSDGSKVVVVDNKINNIQIHYSADAGVTWNESRAPTQGTGISPWDSIAMTPDGSRATVIRTNDTYDVFNSPDSGLSWDDAHPVATDNTRNWQSIAISSDGAKMVLAGIGTYISTSSNFGNNWATSSPGNSAGVGNWYGVTASNDFTKLAAVNNGGYIYTSSDSGSSWTQRTGGGSRSWVAIVSSSDGSKLLAADNAGYLSTSTDSGATWVQLAGAGAHAWQAIAMSPDGSKMAAAGANGPIYTSANSGSTWTTRTGAGTQNWTGITISSDGSKLAAIEGDLGYLYTSADSGATWTQRVLPNRHTWGAYISTSTMSVMGNIINDGGSNSTVRGFVYGLTASYGATTTDSGSFSTGTFTSTLASLSCGQTYHYAAYATNPSGTAYSSDQTFVMPTCLPSTYSLSSCPSIANPFAANLDIDISTEVDARINGFSTMTSGFKSLFLATGGVSTPWTLNPNIWSNQISPVDFSGVSAWNNGSAANSLHATLISPRHVVMANHNATEAGYSLIFVDKNGASVARTMQNTLRIATTDARIGILDEDVPSTTVAFYPVLNFTDYEKYVTTGTNTPLVVPDQHGELDIEEVGVFTPNAASLSFGGPSPSSIRYPYYEGPNLVGGNPNFRGPYTGDSGSPLFFMIGGKPTLGATYLSTVTGPNYGGPTSTINAAMYALGGGYQLSVMSMSCFTPRYLSVVYSAGANGSITGSLSQTVSYGGSGTSVIATGDPGYHFTQWSDASTTGSRTDSSVIANISVTASFVSNTLPAVSVQAASSIAAASAALNGSVDSTNGLAISEHGFAYSTDSTLRSAIATTSLGSQASAGSFNSSVSNGLACGITYYFRAYATNSLGTGYSGTNSFSTTACPIPGGGGGGGGAIPPPPAPPATSTVSCLAGFACSKLPSFIVPKLPESFVADISYGSTSSDVTFLQKFLNSQGYIIAPGGLGSPGNETDYFGSATRAAVKAFQRANGISPANGTVGPATRKLINAIALNKPIIPPAPVVRNLQSGMDGEDVRKLQVFLHAQGYIISIDGPGSPGQESTTFGPATQAAIMRFQMNNDINPANGVVGSTTRAIMQSLSH